MIFLDSIHRFDFHFCVFMFQNLFQIKLQFAGSLRAKKLQILKVRIIFA